MALPDERPVFRPEHSTKELFSGHQQLVVLQTTSSAHMVGGHS